MNRWGITAVAVALSVVFAGPSLAADPPKGSVTKEGVRGPDPSPFKTSPCPAGWKLDPGGTKDNFFCRPVKITLKCPTDTKRVERDCAVGCEPANK